MTSWEATAATKKASQQAQVDAYNWPCPEVEASQNNVKTVSLVGFLTARELEITETADVGILLSNLANQTYSSVEVTMAYCKRALIAHKLTNCLTEIFFERGLARAQELDDYLASTGKLFGPLHGLPISLKDQIAVKGQELNLGYTGWVGQISERDAVMATLLQQQGAVLYTRTNIPQSLMLGESINHVYGRTLNPANRTLTCGGSSGGEGALVGFKGSPIGVGSDVGGSIRIPAAFNGLYGLRPSYNRMPYCLSSNTMLGEEAVPSVLGPISSSVNGLAIFIKAIVDAKPWLLDPVAVRMPWNADAYNLSEHGGPGAKLCFALVKDDGVCKPMPPYLRALEETKVALIAAGHSVVEWSFPKVAEASELIYAIFVADGGSDIKASLALSGEPRVGNFLSNDHADTLTSEYWTLLNKRSVFLKFIMDELNSTVNLTGTGRPFDGVIMPGHAHCPERHGQDHYLSYTSIINLFDYTSAVFPVTQCIPEIDVKLPAHAFRSGADKMVYNLYEPEVYRDAPISLQIVGRKYEEEAVCKMAEIIADALVKSRAKEGRM